MQAHVSQSKSKIFFVHFSTTCKNIFFKINNWVVYIALTDTNNERISFWADNWYQKIQ